MTASKARIIAIVSLGAFWLLADGTARANFVPFLAADVSQPFTPAADNFEFVLSGNKTNQLTGTNINGFGQPNSVTSKFDPTTQTTTIKFAGAGIPTDVPTRHTFGFALNSISAITANPGVVDGYWTTQPFIDGHVASQDISVTYVQALQQAKVTIFNDPDTFTVTNVGYLITNTAIPITSLNRTSLPPAAFVPSGLGPITLQPGTSVSFTVSGVGEGAFFTVFADAKFSGSSSGNPYTDVTGRWFELQTAPEPGSLSLMVVGGSPVPG
jgi:hypothetical protein